MGVSVRKRMPREVQRNRHRINKHKRHFPHLYPVRTRQMLKLRLVDAQHVPLEGLTVTIVDCQRDRDNTTAGQTDARGEIALPTGKSAMRATLTIAQGDATKQIAETTQKLLDSRTLGLDEVEGHEGTVILRTGDILTVA